MSQLQNKLQWSENQVNESKKTQDDLQYKLSSATEELKAQKEKLNEALMSRSQADKSLEDAKEKLAELQVCRALLFKASLGNVNILWTKMYLRNLGRETYIFHSSTLIVAQNIVPLLWLADSDRGR